MLKLTDAQEHSLKLKRNGSQEGLNRRQMKCKWYGNNEVTEQRLGREWVPRVPLGGARGSAEIWRIFFF